MFNDRIFHVKGILYIAMVKNFFSIFLHEFRVYFNKFEISDPIVGCCPGSPKGCDFDLQT